MLLHTFISSAARRTLVSTPAASAAALPAAADLPRVWEMQGYSQRCGGTRNVGSRASNGPWEGRWRHGYARTRNVDPGVREGVAHPERRQIEVVVDRGHGGDEEGTCGGKGGWQKPLSGPPRRGERPRAEGSTPASSGSRSPWRWEGSHSAARCGRGRLIDDGRRSICTSRTHRSASAGLRWWRWPPCVVSIIIIKCRRSLPTCEQQQQQQTSVGDDASALLEQRGV